MITTSWTRPLRGVATFMAFGLYSIEAHAYFDPGIGSIIVQGLVGLGAFLVLTWSNLTTFIRSKLGRTKPEKDIQRSELDSANEEGSANSTDNKMQ